MVVVKEGGGEGRGGSDGFGDGDGFGSGGGWLVVVDGVSWW